MKTLRRSEYALDRIFTDSQENIDRLMETMDKDGNGEVDFDEFLAAMKEIVRAKAEGYAS